LINKATRLHIEGQLIENKLEKGIASFFMLLASASFFEVGSAWAEDTKMGNSWEIKDGVIPEDLRSKLEGIANQETAFETETLPNPPWKEFPKLECGSLGWRMGAGEDYIIGFQKWFSDLNEKEKSYYSFIHLEPNDWTGFYSSLNG